MSRIALGVAVFLAVTTFVIYPPPPTIHPNDLVCTMTFDLSTWFVPSKSSERRGVVDCGDGATLRVRIVTSGARPHDATSMVDGASGTFTSVHSVAEFLGSLADADAERALADDAQVPSKGSETLTLSGGRD